MHLQQNEVLALSYFGSYGIWVSEKCSRFEVGVCPQAFITQASHRIRNMLGEL